MNQEKMVSHLFLVLQFSALTLCMFLSVVESAIPNLATDKEALLSLKSGLGLSPPLWSHNSSSPCNWTGVVCSHEPDQRVVVLDLSGLGLTGTITPHIGNLSFLRSLQLQNNKLTGTIPPEIVNLSRLRSLNMSSNTLQGMLPSNMTQLGSLEVLDLSANNITGRLAQQLGYLRKLQVLNLEKNNFHGSIPPAISNLSILTNMNLGTNSLTGVIPPELGLLQNLKGLDLSANKLSGTVPPSIYNISSLTLFTVASNQLWGEIPIDIGYKLPNLLYFRNCFNQITGKIPSSLHNISGIRSIRMSNNFLQGTVPPGLENLRFIEMYNIGYNQIVSHGRDGLSVITSLTNSTNLQFLALDGNRLEGVIPDSIGNLSKVITNLYLGGNRIYGPMPPSIGHLRSLNLLNVSYNLLAGEIPTEIGQLEELQMLILAGNKLSGYIPNSLGYLRNLNEIDLSRNSFVGNIPPSFSNYHKLLSMDLSSNLLNGSISREILNLPSLSKILNLSNNYLSGSLPAEFVQETVVSIDLSNNNLSGSIPSSIGECSSLETLIMARNTFSGPLPNALVELKGLEFLDISVNQLSGSIPGKLNELLALRYLNLSFNHLEGVIPNGGVFRNDSNVHLEGNTKLRKHYPSVTRGHSRKRVLVTLLIIAPVLLTLALGTIACWFIYIRKRKQQRPTDTSQSILKRNHQMVSYQDLRKATDNFNLENLIGKGSFGSVYKGCLRGGNEIVVKVLDITKAGSWKSFLAECEALKSTRHRNLVKLVTSCSSVDYRNMEFLALVYEYLSNGSLEDWIKGTRKNTDGNGLNIEERLSVAIDVACGLEYLHHECEVPVVHCDLKPSNILLDKDMTAKVGDFGLARLLTDRTGDSKHSFISTNVLKGSIGYIPPEYNFRQKPSTTGDAYSFGVMLLELFTGKSPTHGSFMGDLNLIRWVKLAFPHNLVEVLDPELLVLMGYRPDEGPKSISVQHNCLISIIEVGLSCTFDSPDERLSLRDALHKLNIASKTLSKNAHILNAKDKFQQ